MPPSSGQACAPAARPTSVTAVTIKTRAVQPGAGTEAMPGAFASGGRSAASAASSPIVRDRYRAAARCENSSIVNRARRRVTLQGGYQPLTIRVGGTNIGCLPHEVLPTA